MKKVTYNTEVSRHGDSLWNIQIPVPQDIAAYFIEHHAKRVICTINDQLSFHCAIMSNRNDSYFIMLSKEKRKQLDLMVGTKINVKLEKDESEYGMPMPVEFEELLAMDEEANLYFHKLTPGKQRSLLYIIAKPKKSETRIQKAVVVAEYLKTTEGVLDFKELNQAFKHNNYTR